MRGAPTGHVLVTGSTLPYGARRLRANRTHPREGTVEADQQRWCEVRRGMNATRVQLSKLAAQLYEGSLRFGETGLLARPDWILPEPVDFAAVDLEWLDGSVPPPELTGAEDSTRAVRPLASVERRYQRYTHAIRSLNRPSLFENRLSYRLTDLTWKPGGGRMAFGTTTYFDMVDVCEAAAHEFAAAHLSFNGDGPVPADRASWRRLPLRKQIDDPFDLARRPLLPSVNTLTIRRTESSASFVLHRRDPAKVAVAGGMLHIMPAGVFQPAGISSQAQRHDFDLWRNVMREYSEEFLGDPEHDGSSGSLVDYDHEEPFRSLDQARRDGRVRTWLLGMGLDALVLAGEILSVVVFDADVHDEILGDAVAVNTEGNVVSSGMAGATGIGFNEENIRHIVDHEPIAPSAAACLELAWQHRGRILSR